MSSTVWSELERPLVLMISRLIRCKASVPHDIVRAELVVPPLLVDGLFQTVYLLHRLQDMDFDKLTFRA
eukprot:c49608_g1_i1 orf=3-206(-)